MAQFKHINITKWKGQASDVHKIWGTYEAARGLVRGIRSRLLSTSHAELSAGEPFLLLGAFASRFMAPPFLPSPKGGAAFFLPLAVVFVGRRVSLVFG